MDYDNAKPVAVWSQVGGQDKWLGTAFAVSKDTFMTARHVVYNKEENEKYPDVFIRGDAFKSGPKERLMVGNIYFPEDNTLTSFGVYQHDYALLRVEHLEQVNDIPVANIFDSIDSEFQPDPGVEVRHVGIVNGNGDISSDRDVEFDYASSESQCWVLKGAVKLGESGSPVFTEKGLVGLIKSREHEASEVHVVPASRFKEFIEPFIQKTEYLAPDLSGFPSAKDLVRNLEYQFKNLLPHISSQLNLDTVNSAAPVLSALADKAKDDVLGSVGVLDRAIISCMASEGSFSPPEVQWLKTLCFWCLAIRMDHWLVTSDINKQDLLDHYPDSKLNEIELLVAHIFDTQPKYEVINKGGKDTFVAINSIELAGLESGRDDGEAKEQRLKAFWKKVFGSEYSNSGSISDSQNLDELNDKIWYSKNNLKVTPYGVINANGNHQSSVVASLRNDLDETEVIVVTEERDKQKELLFDKRTNRRIDLTLIEIFKRLEQGSTQ